MTTTEDRHTYGRQVPSYFDTSSVIGEVSQAPIGNVILRVGHMNPPGSAYPDAWHQTEHVVLTPDEARAFAAEVLAAAGGAPEVDLLPEGYYLMVYGNGRPDAPFGPYATIREMAEAHKLSDYPDNGYVAWVDAEGQPSNVPSLNPDDLLSGGEAVEAAAHVFARSAIENDRLAEGHRRLSDEAAAMGMVAEAAHQLSLARQRDRDADHCRSVVAACQTTPDSKDTPT